MQQFAPLLALGLGSRPGGGDAPCQVVVDNAENSAALRIFRLRNRPGLVGQPFVKAGADDLQGGGYRGVGEGLEKIVDDALGRSVVEGKIVDRGPVLPARRRWRVDDPEQGAFFT